MRGASATAFIALREAQVNDAAFGVLDAVEAAEHAGTPVGVRRSRPR
jgi:hypothetical protein